MQRWLGMLPGQTCNLAQQTPAPQPTGVEPEPCWAQPAHLPRSPGHWTGSLLCQGRARPAAPLQSRGRAAGGIWRGNQALKISHGVHRSQQSQHGSPAFAPSGSMMAEPDGGQWQSQAAGNGKPAADPARTPAAASRRTVLPPRPSHPRQAAAAAPAVTPAAAAAGVLGRWAAPPAQMATRSRRCRLAAPPPGEARALQRVFG